MHKQQNRFGKKKNILIPCTIFMCLFFCWPVAYLPRLWVPTFCNNLNDVKSICQLSLFLASLLTFFYIFVDLFSIIHYFLYIFFFTSFFLFLSFFLLCLFSLFPSFFLRFISFFLCLFHSLYNLFILFLCTPLTSQKLYFSARPFSDNTIAAHFMCMGIAWGSAF